LSEIQISQDKIDAFRSKVRQTPGCWEWTGAINADGYGTFWADRQKVGAHRIAYQLEHGAVPSGFQVDHTCHNRACVNPAHLRAATRKQNQENRAGAQANNHAGIRGVNWDSERNCWVVKATASGRTHFGGRFESLDEARACAINLRNKIHTHNSLDRSAV
jgi:hypothetical protein